MKGPSKLWRAFWLAIFFLLVGTVGYSVIEGYSFIDALYMTVITITTVGFGEVHPLSEMGRTFTIFFILSGVGCLAYAFSLITEFIFERAADPHRWEKLMEKKISKLKNHTIICGSGRVGSVTARQLQQSGSPFVIIEEEKQQVPTLVEQRYPYIVGDATRESVLLRAGIKQASALLAMLGSDPENLFTVLTARELNPTLQIIARCENVTSEKRILRAGADSIVSPYVSAGKTVADRVLSPDESTAETTPPDQPLPQWIEGDSAKACYEKTVTEAEAVLNSKILGIRYNGSDTLMPKPGVIINEGAALLCYPKSTRPAMEAMKKATRKTKLIFIDDNPVICRLYTRLFQKAGFEVHLAKTGQDGIKLFQTHLPDAMIIDYHLPDMDGLEVIANIRALEYGDQIKIVLFTANEEDAIRKKALNSGADAVVVKSPEANEIVGQVKKILQ